MILAKELSSKLFWLVADMTAGQARGLPRYLSATLDSQSPAVTMYSWPWAGGAALTAGTKTANKATIIIRLKSFFICCFLLLGDLCTTVYKSFGAFHSLVYRHPSFLLADSR
jgi:hypothetical protein